ncbi:MAG: hypothetical protein LW855_06175 [Alphaproteobacteria bacterium]|jgi:hypothetical protein|nr:hypothetical protein [Thalassospira sp.]MCE2965361.1 hypothetical protein [Alphaproteobacteria bacterium]
MVAAALIAQYNENIIIILNLDDDIVAKSEIVLALDERSYCRFKDCAVYKGQYAINAGDTMLVSNDTQQMGLEVYKKWYASRQQ